MKEISAALVRAQSKFAPALKKSVNPHLRTKYADLATCIDAVIEALNGAGIALTQITHPSDDHVIVETVLRHVSGETLSGGYLHLPVKKADPTGLPVTKTDPKGLTVPAVNTYNVQAFGSALTYARRYSLMTALGIAAEDDDGNDASSKGSKHVGLEALPSNLAAMYSAAETAATSEQLQAAWKAGAHALMGHTEEYRKFKNAVLLRKAQILKASGDAAHA